LSVVAVTSGACAESTSARFWTSSVISVEPFDSPVYWAGTVFSLRFKKLFVNVSAV